MYKSNKRMKKILSSLAMASVLGMTLSQAVANPTNPKLKTDVKGKLSTGVKWTQQSKEYPLLVSSLYHQAADNLRQQSLPSTPWLVVMDIDETLLNNSEYNQRLELTGGSYSSKSWRNWVHEKNAKAIPGAIYFVKTVLELGGQLALVTNRNQLDDRHTWKNLLKVGFPIDASNTCLVGRRPQDKAVMDGVRYINDKDLRREEFTTGKASLCWQDDDQLKAMWQRPIILTYQVGDNIEDIAKTTQENANIEELLKRQGKDILVLPNAMYGSWNH